MTAADMPDRPPPFFARGLAISKVQVFLAKHGISAEQFGRRAVGDAEFVAKLIDRPAELSLADVERVEKFIFDFPKFEPPGWAKRYWAEVQQAPAEEIAE